MGQAGSCKILRFPAVFCQILRLSAAKKAANLAPFVPSSLSLSIPLDAQSLLPAASLSRLNLLRMSAKWNKEQRQFCL